jgi:hypothetical protein
MTTLATISRAGKTLERAPPPCLVLALQPRHQFEELLLDNRFKTGGERRRDVRNDEGDSRVSDAQPVGVDAMQLPSEPDARINDRLQRIFAKANAHAGITSAHHLKRTLPGSPPRAAWHAEPRAHRSLRSGSREDAFGDNSSKS